MIPSSHSTRMTKFFGLLLLTAFLTAGPTNQAQTVLYCSGTVTEVNSGNPVSAHAVVITSDSLPGTTLHFADTVFTDQQGYYSGSFDLSPAMLSGHVVIKTVACNSTTASVFLPYGNQSGFNIQHDFQICLPDTNCHADFSFHQTAPLLIQFTDQSTGIGNGSRFWSFGDGTSSTMENPLHHYYTDGAYTVGLTISNNATGCQDFISKTVVVGDSIPGCQAGFHSSPNPANPLEIHFTDESTGQIYSWFWEFGDNGSSSLQHPDHTYAVEGIYNVCLTIRGADSCQQTICRTITVHAGNECQAQFSYHPDPLTVLPGIPYQFIDLSTGPIDHWDWSFGNGAYSHEQNPVHTFPGPGTYFVCLTVYGGGCQSAWCQYVEVNGNDSCVAWYTFQRAGLTASFIGFLMNSQQGTYDWDFGDGNSASGQNVTHTFAAAGIYPVTLHASDSSGCSTNYQQTVTIGSNPQYHQLYGQAFTGNFPTRNGTVMLFTLDTIQSFYPFFSSSPIDTSGIYVFSMVPEGSYYLYALPETEGYLPTYYGDVQEWTGAPLLQPSQLTNPYPIHFLPAGTLTGGNGAIAGEVRVAGLRYDLLGKIVMLLKDEQGQTLNYQVLNSAGEFDFSSLALGTYFLKGELPGVTSDLVKVVLTAEEPQATVTMTFTGNNLIGINDSAAPFDDLRIYPNPVAASTTISLIVKQPVSIRWRITTVTGQTQSEQTTLLAAGPNEIQIDCSNWTRGVYLLTVDSPDGIRIVRKIIKL